MHWSGRFTIFRPDKNCLIVNIVVLLASCDHRMLRCMSRVRWKDRITNEEVRRRCGVENLEHRFRKMRLRWFAWSCKT